MTQQLVCGEDPEPCERGPAGPLFVPVRPGPAGCVARLFRTPVGGRTAVAFTTPQRLTDELGARQPWIRLSVPALRALTEPLGVPRVTVDPCLTPGPAAANHPSTTGRTQDPSAPRRTPASSAPRLTPAAPRPVAASADTAPRVSHWRDWDPQAVGALRVTGAAALVGALTAWIG
ncbi:SAV_915 family protein [Streptomyces sp. NPDC127108]|uniref:SAV_915 family protein n=1 Tax=Streptomyces sp. NPDC127108 TaxID=3345361 RepID=UPI0036370F03